MDSPVPPPPRGETAKAVVIIGGGVVGALSAFELQRAGHQVTLLEARNWGNGSSSRSAACIRAQFDTPSTIKGMVYCEDYYAQWTSIVGGKQSPMVPNGYLFLKDYAADMEVVRRTVEVQHTAGLAEVEILDRATLEMRFPYLELTGIQGATWCQRDGFLDPAVIYGDATEAAVKLGAIAVQNAEVIGVMFRNGKAVAVRTTDGREFAGDVFINACGAWARGISSLFDGYTLNIEARKRYLYFLEGFNGRAGDFMSHDDFAHLPMLITPRGCYCRPESVHGGKLMMGWVHYALPVNPELDSQDVVEPGFSHLEEGNYGLALRKEMANYLPDVDKMGHLLTETTGFYEDVPDHNPLIGWDPFVANLMHAAGFSGHGLMHAPFTAATVARLVAAGRNLETIQLPGVGMVNVKTFAVDREFKKGEGMVI